MTTDLVLSELRKMNERLERIEKRTAAADEIVFTRDEAAAKIKVSLRQLQRLVAAGLLSALPSGIARAELERYAKAPPVALPRAMTKPKRERTAQDEAARLTQLLKARARRARS